jgi:hypothetical protein
MSRSFRYDDYNPNFKALSKELRFVQAVNRCQQCGAVNRQPHPRFGYEVRLATAHLDQDTKNDAPSNLKALCQSCHLNHDRVPNNAKRKYGKQFARHTLSMDFSKPVDGENT